MKIETIRYSDDVWNAESLHSCSGPENYNGISGHIINDNYSEWHGKYENKNSMFRSHWYFDKLVGCYTTSRIQFICGKEGQFGETLLLK